MKKHCIYCCWDYLRACKVCSTRTAANLATVREDKKSQHDFCPRCVEYLTTMQYQGGRSKCEHNK